MEFWGVELKGNKPVKVEPGMSQVVHLSQATLAEIKKGSEPITIYAKTGDQKLVIGILTADNFPQLSFDLVFEKEFELSHNSKNGNVHLTGYRSFMPDDTEEDDFSDESDDEEVPALVGLQNGAAAAPVAAKPKPAAVAAKNEDKPKEESDSSDDSDEDDEDDSDLSGDDEMAAADESDDSDEEDSDEDESDEDEETPAKSAGDKKRPAAPSKTPEPKKAKIVTPQKTDGKKSAGGHVATPYPSKNNKASPKSGAQFSSGSKKGGFNSHNSNKKKGKFGGK